MYGTVKGSGVNEFKGGIQNQNIFSYKKLELYRCEKIWKRSTPYQFDERSLMKEIQKNIST